MCAYGNAVGCTGRLGECWLHFYSLSLEASMATEVDDGFGRGAKKGNKMVVGEGLCQG